MPRKPKTPDETAEALKAQVAQVKPDDTDTDTDTPADTPPKRKRGRPKGSKSRRKDPEPAIQPLELAAGFYAAGGAILPRYGLDPLTEDEARILGDGWAPLLNRLADKYVGKVSAEGRALAIALFATAQVAAPRYMARKAAPTSTPTPSSDGDS